ncbi:hypothetical protein [Zooshikella harenae]|uniref:Secreted protein n=1 Tax=Zooshikella harenae TaxID=2827238 RepID=A0ABS5ZHD0_9GAMM|nr:hypothetical protein [Zooshikella harenae]MBU2713468.1 hypothetical protein [Zooshikella harenae]
MIANIFVAGVFIISRPCITPVEHAVNPSPGGCCFAANSSVYIIQPLSTTGVHRNTTDLQLIMIEV